MVYPELLQLYLLQSSTRANLLTAEISIPPWKTELDSVYVFVIANNCLLIHCLLRDLSPFVHTLTDKPSILKGIQITWMILVKRPLSITGRGSFKIFLNVTTAIHKPPANCIFYFSILVDIKKDRKSRYTQSWIQSLSLQLSWHFHGMLFLSHQYQHKSKWAMQFKYYTYEDVLYILSFYVWIIIM